MAGGLDFGLGMGAFRLTVSGFRLCLGGRRLGLSLAVRGGGCRL